MSRRSSRPPASPGAPRGPRPAVGATARSLLLTAACGLARTAAGTDCWRAASSKEHAPAGAVLERCGGPGCEPDSLGLLYALARLRLHSNRSLGGTTAAEAADPARAGLPPAPIAGEADSNRSVGGTKASEAAGPARADPPLAPAAKEAAVPELQSRAGRSLGGTTAAEAAEPPAPATGEAAVSELQRRASTGDGARGANAGVAAASAGSAAGHGAAATTAIDELDGLMVVLAVIIVFILAATVGGVTQFNTDEQVLISMARHPTKELSIAEKLWEQSKSWKNPSEWLRDLVPDAGADEYQELKRFAMSSIRMRQDDYPLRLPLSPFKARSTWVSDVRSRLGAPLLMARVMESGRARQLQVEAIDAKHHHRGSGGALATMNQHLELHDQHGRLVGQLQQGSGQQHRDFRFRAANEDPEKSSHLIFTPTGTSEHGYRVFYKPSGMRVAEMQQSGDGSASLLIDVSEQVDVVFFLACLLGIKAFQAKQLAVSSSRFKIGAC